MIIRISQAAVLLFLCICVNGAFSLNAQEAEDKPAQETELSSDVKTTDLQEYVVTAKNAYYKDGVLKVYPSKRDKERASSGFELLQYLQLPQLIYTAGSNTITHISGSLAYYINGIPASESEVMSLNIEDVKNVEYMDFPQDPKFGHNQHVINFILTKYKHGGYTRIQQSDNLTDLGNTSRLYSKYTINDLSFDLNVLSSNSKTNTLREEKNVKYLFEDNQGKEVFFNQETNLISDNNFSNYIPVSFRIQLAKPKYLISNTINYQHNGHPDNERLLGTEYSGVISENSKSGSRSSSYSNSVSWNGLYRFSLPESWFLYVTPSFEYNHNKQFRISNSGVETLPDVVYKNREKNYIVNYAASASKSFQWIHTLYFGVQGSNSWYYIDYLGTSVATSKMNRFDLTGYAGYNYNYDNRLFVGVRGGCSYSRSENDGIPQSACYPFASLDFNYNISEKQNLYVSGSYSPSFVPISCLNTSAIQVGDFLYVKGDENLKTGHVANAVLSYSFMPNNMFRLGLLGSYEGAYNYIAYKYDLYEPGKGVLSIYDNVGDFHSAMLILNFGINNIANRLSLSLSPSLTIENETGLYANTLLNWQGRVNATCFLDKGFTVTADFNTPRKSCRAGILTKYNMSYSIGGKWSWKGLHLQLNLYNIFGGIKWSEKRAFNSRYYQTASETRSFSARPRVNLSVTYTFSYGKKVRHDDEVGTPSKGSSGAIGY